MYYVYKLVHRKSGKFYIGSCSNLELRVARHVKDLKKRTHHCSRLQKLVNKQGLRLKVVLVKKYDTRDKAYAREQRLLDKYIEDCRLLNTGKGSYGGDNLSRNENREAIIKKISKSLRKTMQALTPEERIEKFGKSGEANGMYGKTHSDAVKQRLSELNKGNTYAKGSVRSAETRDKLRKLRLAESSREDYVNNFAGKSHTKKTKKVLSDKAKARMAKPGFVHAQAKPIRIGKKKYIGVSAAARKLGVCPATIVYRLKAKNYPDYSYID